MKKVNLLGILLIGTLSGFYPYVGSSSNWDLEISGPFAQANAFYEANQNVIRVIATNGNGQVCVFTLSNINSTPSASTPSCIANASGHSTYWIKAIQSGSDYFVAAIDYLAPSSYSLRLIKFNADPRNQLTVLIDKTYNADSTSNRLNGIAIGKYNDNTIVLAAHSQPGGTRVTEILLVDANNGDEDQTTTPNTQRLWYRTAKTQSLSGSVLFQDQRKNFNNFAVYDLQVNSVGELVMYGIGLNSSNQAKLAFARVSSSGQLFNISFSENFNERPEHLERLGADQFIASSSSSTTLPAAQAGSFIIVDSNANLVHDGYAGVSVVAPENRGLIYDYVSSPDGRLFSVGCDGGYNPFGYIYYRRAVVQPIDLNGGPSPSIHLYGDSYNLKWFQNGRYVEISGVPHILSSGVVNVTSSFVGLTQIL